MMPLKNISEEKICPVCGKHFKRKRFGERLEDYTRFQNRIYCSKSCSAHRKMNDQNRDRKCFHALARKHLKEYCAICGSTEHLQVHHWDKNIKNNSPENLETLCATCHMKLHWRLRRLSRNVKKHAQDGDKNR